MTIYNWSTTAGSNASSDATADLAANQPGIDTRNSVRAIMARIAAWLDQIGGACTYGGSGNAYTITSPSGHALTSYATGHMLALVPNATNTGAATVNVDSLGAKAIKRPTGGDLASGDLASGGRYLLVYDGTNFQVFGDVPSAASGVYQPLDATLTAWGGLTFSGTNAFAYATGSDAFAATDAAGFRTQLGLTSTATTALSSLVQTTGTQIVDGAKTLTSDLTFSTDLTGVILSGGGRMRDQASPARTLLQPNNDTLSVISEDGSTVLATLTASGLSIGGSFDTVYHAGNLPGTAFTFTALQTFAANLTCGTPSAGPHIWVYNNATATLGLGNDMSGAAYELSIFAGGDADNLGRISFGRRRSDTGTYTERMALDCNTGVLSGALTATAVAISAETSGALTGAACRNRQVHLSDGATLPASGMTDGDWIVLDPRGTARTITRPAGHTMYVHDVDVESCTTPAHNAVSAKFCGGSKWIVQGAT